VEPKKCKAVQNLVQEMGIFDFFKVDNKTTEEYFALATEKIQNYHI